MSSFNTAFLSAFFGKLTLGKLTSFVLACFLLFSFNARAQTSLTVGTIERPPMVMKTQAGEWTGFSIDLLKSLSQNLGFEYQLQVYEHFTQMVDDTQQSKVDFSIANISITSAREQVMDYSQPIFDSGLQIMVNKSGDKASIVKIIINSGIVWFVLGALALLLLIAHLLWFFERNTPNSRHDYFRDDYFGGVWDAFWWAFIIMTMGGFENEVPASKFSRFLAMFWIIVSLFFISTLTAKITSSMTVSELSSSIASVEDLSGKKVGVIDSPATIGYIENKLGTRPRVFKQYEAMYQALAKKQIDAIVGDAPMLTYHASHQGKAYFKMVGSLFKAEKYGILFPDGAALKERIDQALLEMVERGEYQVLYDRYFSN